MKIRCGRCGKDMGTKDGQGVKGTSDGMCDKCFEIESSKSICINLNTCYKIQMIRDKDLSGDWQYAEAMRDVCAKCDNKVVK